MSLGKKYGNAFYSFQILKKCTKLSTKELRKNSLAEQLKTK